MMCLIASETGSFQKSELVMDLRTTISLDHSPVQISYNSNLMLIGSCFTSEIGAKLEEGKFSTIINPTGILYNPVSIADAIDLIISKRNIGEGDLLKFGNLWISLLHDSKFSSRDQHLASDRINTATEKAHDFLKGTDLLFVTFGTARVYRFNQSGKIVSNCHKIPAGEFSPELLEVEEITSRWSGLIDSITNFNKNLKLVFTISPVRHWKDGAHGNQISKSTLLLAVEKLMEHKAVLGYFPAYELVMDDLRDYRFYAEDMLHVSSRAVEYIWEKFKSCYMDTKTLSIYSEVCSITKAEKHRFLTDSDIGRRTFATTILNKISDLEKKHTFLDFTDERKRFESILEGNI